VRFRTGCRCRSSVQHPLRRTLDQLVETGQSRRAVNQHILRAERCRLWSRWHLSIGELAMRRSDLRWIARLGAVAVLFITILPAITVSAGSPGSLTTANACQNSATGTFTDIDITLSGTASGDASSVTLSR